MHPTLKRLSILCSGALLLACADLGSAPSAPAAESTGDAYRLGRGHHLAARTAQALQYYQAALRANPGHVHARNALAALHAEQGDLAAAIGIWQQMTEHASGPGSAFLFSNLGYAHFLRGQLGPARAALEKACVLDPLNHRAWRHLGDTLARMGEQERAEAMYRQAEALQGHDFKSDYAIAPGSGVAAIDSALHAARDEDGWARTEISVDSGGLFVMRRVEPAGRAAGPAPAEQASGLPMALLEISNGNGVTGMARSLARTMGEGSLRVVRLTNQKGFGVRQSRVEYRGQFKAAAEALAERVGAPQVIEVESTGRADMRLVIGRDLVRPVSPALAAAAKAPARSG